MKRYEPGRWNDTAKGRPDVAASKLKPPSVLFPKELYFDDGKQRVELVHLGVAHTHGDAFAWLPKERILFSGDACVNGPYNFVGDGSIEKWIGTLAEAKKLGARILCPGHGPRGAGGVIDDQRAFFVALRDGVGKLVHAKKSAAEVRAAVPQIATAIKANAQTARYVDNGGIVAQCEKVYTELTGQRFPVTAESSHARLAHARQHGRAAA